MLPMPAPRAKPTSTPGGRARDTRERLLDAALAVFEEHGWVGYTVHSVIAASGISLGSLYHHFGSMDGLTAALYARCMAALLDEIGAAATEQRSARTVVVAIVQAYLAFTRRERAAAAFIHGAPASTALSAAQVAALAADKAPRMERITGAIRPHVRGGAIVAIPEPLLEMMIIGPPAETARRWLAGVPGIDLEEAARVLPERVWRSVRA